MQNAEYERWKAYYRWVNKREEEEIAEAKAAANR